MGFSLQYEKPEDEPLLDLQGTLRVGESHRNSIAINSPSCVFPKKWNGSKQVLNYGWSLCDHLFVQSMLPMPALLPAVPLPFAPLSFLLLRLLLPHQLLGSEQGHPEKSCESTRLEELVLPSSSEMDALLQLWLQ